MPPDLSPRNPYIAGKALGDEHSFFGREDVFRLVETVLSSADQNALVLFGQRRIGKTSILLQLRRHVPSPLLGPIYFDLMDRARKPFSTVLYELAATIASEFNLPQPHVSDFAEGDHFRESFLPSLYRSLDKNTRPVLLLDEFDGLDVAAEEQLPATAAARAFFPYLRRLMEGEPLLAFVFVVGRKAEDLSIDIKATFKATRYQRISVLDEESARSLVRLAEGDGSLQFTTAAIDRLLSLTARHPYLTQLMCQLLFDLAYAALPSDTPTIDVSDVEAVVPKVLEAGENVFEWIWDGLPPAERVIFSAVAGATGENAVITEDELMSILQRHGIRILIRELELAPKTLIEWEMLRRTDGGYGFFIELMRRWVAERKALPKVKDELDRVNPIADRHYQLGNDYYRLGNLREPNSQLQDALRANPNHLKARLLMGETLREEGAIEEAVRALEEAYRYDEDAARHPLVRALLAQGESIEQSGREDDALNIDQRVLAISPREAVAREKLAEILSIRRKRALESMAAEVAMLVQGEEWDKAAEVYTRLVELDPEDQCWAEGLKQVEQERGLARRYAEGLGAMQQNKWAEAQRAFADVVYERPAYQDAATLLASATRQGRPEPAATQMQLNAWLSLFGRRRRQVAIMVAPVLLLFLLGLWIIERPPPDQSTPGPPSPTPRLLTLTGHTGVVSSVAFSPDGQLLASGSADQSVRLWKVGDGSLVRELTGHTRPVLSVAFNSDGQLLASGSIDQSVRLWMVGDGSLARELTGHTNWVQSVAFSPDGQLLASASNDQTVRLWKASDGRLVRELTGHTGQVQSVAFSPDGQLLASASSDLTVRLWTSLE